MGDNFDESRSEGAALAASIELDKDKRGKARDVKPLRQLWPFIANYKGMVFAFFLFLVLAAAMQLSIGLAVKIITDCGFVGDGQATADYCSRFSVGDSSKMGSYFKFAMLIGVGAAVFGALRFYFISVLGQRVIADIRKAVYDKLTRLSPEFFERVHTGEVLSRLTTDTTLIESVIGSSVSFATNRADYHCSDDYNWQTYSYFVTLQSGQSRDSFLTSGRKSGRYSNRSSLHA